MKLRNTRDGEWEIPALNLIVGSDTFDVDDPDIARNLLEQGDNYAPADDEARALADEIAAEREEHDEAAAAIGDVGDMTAHDVLAMLDNLTPDELRDVRSREQAGKARVTVLNRIEELLEAGAPGEEV